MRDYGNDPDWYISAAGAKYHKKPAAIPEPERVPTLLGRLLAGLWDVLFVGMLAAALAGVLTPETPRRVLLVRPDVAAVRLICEPEPKHFPLERISVLFWECP